MKWNIYKDIGNIIFFLLRFLSLSQVKQIVIFQINLFFQRNINNSNNRNVQSFAQKIYDITSRFISSSNSVRTSFF